MTRRDLLRAAVLAGGAALLGEEASAGEPFPDFVVSGDVGAHQAVITSRAHGRGLMLVEWATTKDFRNPVTTLGSAPSPGNDFTGRAQLEKLPDASRIYYRIRFGKEAPIVGSFPTPPRQIGRPVRFLWGGDVCGQGWGIDPAHGGMLTFASMAAEEPHLFLHNGDSIYADVPLPATIPLDGGGTWKNLLIPEKTRKAQTIGDFRGNFRYNFLDPHYREFFRSVPVIAQWDDHEVRDNWEPRRDQVLAQRSYRAFHEYWPMRPGPIFRRIPYGPEVDFFALDLRSYRTPNGANRSPEDKLLGRIQLNWFMRELKRSNATWKIVAGEMPIATCAPAWGLDNWANGEGPPAGRELELAELLGFLKKNRIHNVVFLSADVHYSAAFHFRPERAQFKDFDPFWEFVAGPLHAGTYGPSGPDDPTFGPELVFLGVPPKMRPNRPPSDGLQFYGRGEVMGRKLRISLHRRDGREIFKQVLDAV